LIPPIPCGGEGIVRKHTCHTLGGANEQEKNLRQQFQRCFADSDGLFVALGGVGWVAADVEAFEYDVQGKVIGSPQRDRIVKTGKECKRSSLT